MSGASLSRRAVAALALAVPWWALAASPLAGHHFTSHRSKLAEYTPSGSFVRSLELTDDAGESRGIAFGPEGLYVVRSDWSTSSVQVIDESGAVLKSYRFGAWTGGLATSGNLRFAPGKDVFYVSALDGLYRFKVGHDHGSLLIPGETTDVAVMPNGDLLVAAEYSVSHYTSDGQLLGTVTDIADPLGLGPGDARLANVRGVAYDRATRTTFVMMLGYSDFRDKLLALKGTTNELKGLTTYWYGSIVSVTGDGHLLLGSWTQAPGVFAFSDTVPMTFTQTGTLGSENALFVTSKRPARAR